MPATARLDAEIPASMNCRKREREECVEREREDSVEFPHKRPIFQYTLFGEQDPVKMSPIHQLESDFCSEASTPDVSEASIPDVSPRTSHPNTTLQPDCRPHSSLDALGASQRGNNAAAIDLWEGIDLPESCIRIFIERGITAPYDWQKECLGSRSLQQGKSLVYTLPTSAGKTFVAEVVLLRSILTANKSSCKLLFIVPFVTLAREKAESLEAFARHYDFTVDCFQGAQGKLPLPKRTKQICVATIEKAERIITSLLEEGRMNELKLVVCDELHFVAEPGRGPLLEVLLGKLLWFFRWTQIIAMSATLPNLDQICRWLRAEPFTSQCRPVQLHELAKCGRSVWAKDKFIRTLPPPTVDDPDHLLYLVQEAAREHSVLVFCATKASTEAVASWLAERGPFGGSAAGAQEGRQEALARLERSDLGERAGGALGRVVRRGVAFHHGGLASEEREVVEEAFKARAVSVLVATTTLAAGVNLPARRVIIRSPYLAGEFIAASRFKQMAGRAGRAGYDEVGEAYVLVGPRDEHRARELLSSGPQHVRSLLLAGGGGEDAQGGAQQGGHAHGHAHGEPAAAARGGEGRESDQLLRAVLGFVCGHAALGALNARLKAAVAHVRGEASVQGAVEFVQQALLAGQDQEVGPRVERAVAQLEQRGLVTSGEGGLLGPTQLGRGTYMAAMPIDTALGVCKDLDRAREQGIVLVDQLHLLFLLTPTHVLREPDWNIFASLFARFSASRRTVAERVGVEERFVCLRAEGRAAHKSEKFLEQLRAAKRLWGALMLQELVDEVPISAVLERYSRSGRGREEPGAPKLDKGSLEDLQGQSASFAAMVASLACNVGLEDLGSLLQSLISRIAFGAKHEVLPLCEIPFVKVKRARALYRCGLKTVEDVARADAGEMSKLLGPALGPKPKEMAAKVIKQAQGLLRKQLTERAAEIADLTSDDGAL